MILSLRRRWVSLPIGRLVWALSAPLALAGCANDVPTNGGGPTDYVLELRFVGRVPTGPTLAAFEAAAETIRQTITATLPPVGVPGGFEVGDCDPSDPNYQDIGNQPTGTIHGLIIYVNIRPMDGAGGTLGSAGPCLVRSLAQGGLPALGILRLDSVDVAQKNTPVLEKIVLHELLHVVGFGTVWKDHGLRDTSVVLDARFLGPRAQAACFVIHLGGNECAEDVPVHSTGGAGSAYSHWFEDFFTNELMTPFLDDGETPFSEMTIESLRDLGYSVSTSTAQLFIVGAATRSVDSGVDPAAPRQPLAEPLRPVFEVDEFGRLHRIGSPQ